MHSSTKSSKDHERVSEAVDKPWQVDSDEFTLELSKESKNNSLEKQNKIVRGK